MSAANPQRRGITIAIVVLLAVGFLAGLGLFGYLGYRLLLSRAMNPPNRVAAVPQNLTPSAEPTLIASPTTTPSATPTAVAPTATSVQVPSSFWRARIMTETVSFTNSVVSTVNEQFTRLTDWSAHACVPLARARFGSMPPATCAASKCTVPTGMTLPNSAAISSWIKTASCAWFTPAVTR